MLGGSPAFREDTFNTYAQTPSNVMTMGGTVVKSGVLVAITVVTGAIAWMLCAPGGTFDGGMAMPFVIGGVVGGLVLALVTIFKPSVAPYTAPFYAAAEGLFLGAISAFYELAYGGAGGAELGLSGIVLQAAGLTLAVLAVMLVLYGTRIIKVTAKLRAGIIAATGAVMLFYLVSIVMSLFGATMPYLHSASPLGIGISLVIVGIAAFNLLLDFDLIERGVQGGSPKYMEWYAGFALLVTLVWLYLEILRLLAKLRSR
ncbi:MAG: Bax inhibitor-1/YccA family protein [Planctomycetota bacterium]